MTISAERERQLLASVAYRSDALRAIQFLLARVRELEKREDELTAALEKIAGPTDGLRDWKILTAREVLGQVQ